MDLESQERSKYQRMWERPEYRINSHGQKCARIAITEMGAAEGDEIFDFGCGLGRASQIFVEEGLVTTGIDIAENAPDEQDGWSFVIANLWDLPSGFTTDPADWGFCCDVMEHIPEEKVSDVFANISRAVTKGCFFAACLGPSGMGKLIGETLHLTVESPEWWREAAEPHFKELLNFRREPGYAVFIGSNA